MTQRVDKLGPGLVELLDSSDADSHIGVVVELQPLEFSTAGSREDRVTAAREAFARELRPVAEAIERVNGQVVETTWLNQTIRALVPVRSVRHLATQPEVVGIALPSRIQPDSVGH
jgi:hypothetical protein